MVQPAHFTITDIRADGSSQVIADGNDDGTGGCSTATITPPTGTEHLRLDVTVNGIVDTKSTSFQVAGAGGVPGTTNVSLEAEATGNSFFGDLSIVPCDACSGGQKVTGMQNGNGGGALWFNNVSVPVAGNYTLTIYYTNGSSAALSEAASVNEEPVSQYQGTQYYYGIEPIFPPTGGWDTVGHVQLTVRLWAGLNGFQFDNGSGSYDGPDFDKITVSGPN